MNGSYSRIRQVGKTRSQSIDLSDLSFSSHTPRSNAKNIPKAMETRKKNHTMADLIPESENEDGIGEIFGEILNRKCSLRSHKDMAGRSYVQTVVKRSFSLKRSSSVADGYSRIHNRSDFAADDDDEDLKNSKSQTKPMKKKGKILQVCWRLFGF